MSQLELLKKALKVLDDAGIEYMLTGSFVSSMQGEPRSTHDIDIVVAIDKTSVSKLVNAFRPPDYYLDEERVFEAIDDRDMFNLIDVTGGDKIDFWLLTEDSFDQSRFARKRVEQVFDMRMSISTPEDTILVKLRWSKLSGGSEKQFTDALRVYEVQFSILDMIYLTKWAKILDIELLFQRLQQEARTI